MTKGPVPFEITQQGGLPVASNGAVRLVGLDGATLKRRRGISGLALKPAAETVIPQLNALCGELLSNLAMNAEEVAGRIMAIAGSIPTADPVRTEWIIGELNGVKVYTDGQSIVLTTQDLSING